jgi:hypothetical protein
MGLNLRFRFDGGADGHRSQDHGLPVEQLTAAHRRGLFRVFEDRQLGKWFCFAQLLRRGIGLLRRQERIDLPP